MAGRRRYSAYGRGGKSAYRYTAKRQQALRRAQYISAQKRKRNAKIKKAATIGVLSAGAVGAGVYLGKADGAKNIRVSVKNAGAFGKDLTSAFRAVEPRKKEQTRKDRAISRKRRESERGREAARSAGNKTVLQRVGKEERKRLQKEAEGRTGPTWLDKNTFNDDGTVAPKVVFGDNLSDRELRQGIARSSRARARNGGQGLTTKQKNDAFKILKANQKAAGGPVNPTQGKKTADRVPKITASSLGGGEDEVSRVFKAALKQRYDDEELLRKYSEFGDK